jgi:hypothetical protein
MLTATEKTNSKEIKRWATKSVKAIITMTGSKDKILQITNARFGDAVTDVLTEIFAEAERINDKKFYCGRCMRFFDTSTVNPQRLNALSGGILYCDNCSQSKGETYIDIKNGVIVRSDEKLQDLSDDIVENGNAYEEWKLDSSNPQKTIELLKKIIIPEIPKQKYYIEVVLKRHTDWRDIKTYFNWVETTTRCHRILMATSDKQLTQDQIDILLVLAESLETSRL